MWSLFRSYGLKSFSKGFDKFCGRFYYYVNLDMYYVVERRFVEGFRGGNVFVGFIM